MASLAIKLLFEPIRSLGFASIGAGYMGVGTAIEFPARQILVQNTTDAELMFSFDGVTNHFMLPASGFLLLDVTSNKTQSSGFYIEQGTRLYVKDIDSPITGSVYFSVMHGAGE